MIPGGKSLIFPPNGLQPERHFFRAHAAVKNDLRFLPFLSGPH
jgi:hypothetical protein